MRASCRNRKRRDTHSCATRPKRSNVLTGRWLCASGWGMVIGHAIAYHSLEDEWERDQIVLYQAVQLPCHSAARARHTWRLLSPTTGPTEYSCHWFATDAGSVLLIVARHNRGVQPIKLYLFLCTPYFKIVHNLGSKGSNWREGWSGQIAQSIGTIATVSTRSENNAHGC